MRIEDIEREFREMDESLKRAHELARQGETSQASELFMKCLGMLEQAYGPEHPQTAECLEGLADSLYAGARHEEAVEAYRRLSIIGEKVLGSRHPDVIATIFKGARCYDKLNRPDEAHSLYARALRLADQSLPPGNALLGSLLEGYSASLRRAQRSPQLAHDLEERARLNREVASDPSSRSARLRNLRQPGESAEEDEEQGGFLERVGGAAKEKPHAILSLFVVAALIPLSVYFLSLMPRGAAPSMMSPQESSLSGRTYTSLDGQKSISFTSAAKAKAVIAGREYDAQYTVKEGGLQTDASAEGVIAVTDDRLTDADGTVLYESPAPELKLAQTMRTLAASAQRLFAVSGEYPQDLDSWNDSRYKNPYTGQEESPSIIYLGKDRSWRPDAPTDRPAIESHLLLQAQDKTGGGGGGEAPKDGGQRNESAIDCGYILVDSAAGNMDGARSRSNLKAVAFFIRGKDRNGRYLRGSQPGVLYLCSLLNGRSPQIAGQFSSRSSSPLPEKLVVLKK